MDLHLRRMDRQNLRVLDITLNHFLLARISIIYSYLCRSVNTVTSLVTGRLETRYSIPDRYSFYFSFTTTSSPILGLAHSVIRRVFGALFPFCNAVRP
jgi:hypothetical protein